MVLPNDCALVAKFWKEMPLNRGVAVVNQIENLLQTGPESINRLFPSHKQKTKQNTQTNPPKL